jgi:flagellar basal body-associated protein FliL
MRSEIRDRINQIMPTGGVNAVYFVNFVLQ